MTDNVIPFPPQLRVVSAPVDEPSPERMEAVLVDHGGRAYPFLSLVAHLSRDELEQIAATAPRSGQAAWDEVVRRWPALADEVVAGCVAP